MAEGEWVAGARVSRAPESTDLLDVAELDLARAARRGYPEAVYCEGKTADQVRAIAARLHAAAADGETQGAVLFTRATPEHAAARG